MDIAFEKNLSSHRSGMIGSPEGDVHPEWAGLFARLRAAQHTWQTLDRQAAEDLARACGSFDKDAARCIGLFGDSLRSVNPVDSANRNGSRDIEVDVAGPSSTGDRG